MAKSGAKSGGFKVSNILVWTLLGLLIFALAGFGLGGFGGNVRSIGSVGGTDMNLQAYARAIDAELQQIRRESGQPITFAQAEQFGLTQQVLQAQVGRTALEEAARLAGISVGDEAVADRVRSMPAFQGPTGGFDREAYSFVLDRSGMTTREFEDSIRSETASSILQNALVSNLTPPDIFGTTLYRYLAEARTVEFVTLTADALTEQPAPVTEAEARAYYDDNPEAFTLPERKVITYTWLTPQDLADDVEVTEQELRTLYDERDAIYNRPERRMVSRLGFPDQAAADAARAAIDAGETTFDDLVIERGLTADDVDLGAVSASGLGADASAAVFALDDTGVAGPVDSAVGPALFQVNAILLASEVSFEDAEAELRQDATLTAARRLVDAEVEPIDDLLAGGATLEEVADGTAMTLGTMEWGGDVAIMALPRGLPEFEMAAEALTADDFPELTITDGGNLFAMRLDEVIPPTLQPFEDVRVDAEEAAAQAKMIAALQAQADAIEAALADGQSLTDQGWTSTVVTGVTRQTLAFDLPVPLLTDIYELGDGDVATVAEGDTVHVAQVTGVTPPDTGTEEAEQLLLQLRLQTSQAMSDDLLTLFARAISTEAGISLDQAAIEAVHNNFR